MAGAVGVLLFVSLAFFINAFLNVEGKIPVPKGYVPPANRTKTTTAAPNATAAYNSTECFANELYHQGHCYHFKNDVGMPFEGARAYCLKRKSHMVIIDNEDENRWLLTQDKTRFGRWIGMMRVDEGSGIRFHWVPDDSSPGYTNFNDLKMDYFDQRCIYMDTDGRWADNTCNQPYNVICERNPLTANIAGLQAALNSSVSSMQNRLATIENLFRKKLVDTAPVNNLSFATLTSKVDAMLKLVTQTKNDAILRKQQHDNYTKTASATLKQLSTALTGLSQLLSISNRTAQNNIEIKQRLDIIRDRSSFIANRVDNLTSTKQFNNQMQTLFLPKLQKNVADLEEHVKAGFAQLTNATNIEARQNLPNTFTTNAAALYGAGQTSAVNNRVPVALILLVLVLPVALICIVILLGLYVRNRHKSDRSFQYNVSAASSRFANNSNNNNHHLLGRDSLALTTPRTGRGADDQQRVVYEEIEHNNNRGSGTLVRGGTPVMPTNESDGSSSVDSARTDSIYMSTIDAAVAELEINNSKLSGVVRDSDVESSAGSTLPRHNSMYDPHNDKKKLVPPIVTPKSERTGGVGGNNIGSGVVRF